jgi:L-Ala-D/L-Glu epimerase
VKLQIDTFDLPLKHPFTISRGTITVQETLIVRLSHGPYYGLGEATVNDFYGASVSSMTHALESVRSALEKSDPLPPAELWQQLDGTLSGNRFAQCSLDCAAWDLWSKIQGVPARAAMGIPEGKNADDCSPPSCFTIGIDRPEVMIQKLLEMPGWPVYKVKLGGGNDLHVLRLLRERTTARFRVDANCGWTVESAKQILPELKELGVEFVEQPLPVGDSGMAYLHSESPLPLMADESCEQESDVAGCKDQFHAINIKLVKCGGLTPALRMISQAREIGLKIMVGCMTESSIGISAAAQLLPLIDFADMDGAVLLARDIATGVSVDQGKITVPDKPGLGVELL